MESVELAVYQMINTFTGGALGSSKNEKDQDANLQFLRREDLREIAKDIAKQVREEMKPTNPSTLEVWQTSAGIPFSFLFFFFFFYQFPF